MSVGFATALKVLIGKDIEIYQGTEHEILLRAEKEFSRKSVIRGKLLNVIEECLILECDHGGSKATIFINAWSVYSAMEVHKEVTLHNVYHASDSRQSRR